MRWICLGWFLVAIGFTFFGSRISAQAQSGAAIPIEQIVPGGEIGEFRHGTFPSLGQRTHAGIDIVPIRCNEPVHAWSNGTVADVITSSDDRNFNSLGYMVLLSHGAMVPNREQTYSVYLHLFEPPANDSGERLKVGDLIPAGSQIGRVGDTGAAYGCHLHFEIRHFASRFSPTWNNIYGAGDQHREPAFLREWTDPTTLEVQAASQNLFADYSDRFLGDEEVEVRTTSAANWRNYPSTDGTDVLGTLQAGAEIRGRWVRDIESDRRWLKISTGGYVWDGNLAIADNTLVGTWELVGSQCCGEMAFQDGMPWKTAPSGRRERVTFFGDGRFTSNRSRNISGSYRIERHENGYMTVHGWIYSVGVSVMGDAMIVTHISTTMQNAYTELWKRVQNSELPPVIDGPNTIPVRYHGSWDCLECGCAPDPNKRLNIGPTQIAWYGTEGTVLVVINRGEYAVAYQRLENGRPRETRISLIGQGSNATLIVSAARSRGSSNDTFFALTRCPS